MADQAGLQHGEGGSEQTVEGQGRTEKHREEQKASAVLLRMMTLLIHH